MSRTAGASVDLAAVETNLVNMDLEVPADAVVRLAKEHGLLINAIAPRRLRAVLHLDVSRADVDAAADILASAIQKARAT